MLVVSKPGQVHIDYSLALLDLLVACHTRFSDTGLSAKADQQS